MLQPESSASVIKKHVEEAFSKLLRQDHSSTMKRCDVVYLPSSRHGRYIVNVLNKTFTVELDIGSVVDLTLGKEAGEKLSYVLLEYLTGEGHSASPEGWVSVETVLLQPSHKNYYQKAVVRPLEKLFGYDRELFEAVSRRLMGRREKLGGTAYSFQFLPKVQALVQVWVGNTTEFTKPKINTSFNSGARRFLGETALVYLFEVLADFMEKAARKMKS
ncbi:MAG: DUF3786 domain-containing protein [Candidatus Caldarchaeum sp.]